MFRENPPPPTDEGGRRRSVPVSPDNAQPGAPSPHAGIDDVSRIASDLARTDLDRTDLARTDLDRTVDVEEVQAELRRQFRRLEKERRDLAAERMALEREAEAIRGRFRAEVVALRDLVASLTDELDQIVQHRKDA